MVDAEGRLAYLSFLFPGASHNSTPPMLFMLKHLGILKIIPVVRGAQGVGLNRGTPVDSSTGDGKTRKKLAKNKEMLILTVICLDFKLVTLCSLP
ncbi:hypothetical protein O6P43_010373 [Quillaja saponaria]|uniref:Uncharacterized protein n=1 Tax=Quillaja saponaria TaxID=32244 RepID=A0AAD7Q0C0_QUISA|nr:hypothetical protein O6P43_010373 [Quillaja saponaria]